MLLIILTDQCKEEYQHRQFFCISKFLTPSTKDYNRILMEKIYLRESRDKLALIDFTISLNIFRCKARKGIILKNNKCMNMI